jgi:hypothetical protein
MHNHSLFKDKNIGIIGTPLRSEKNVSPCYLNLVTYLSRLGSQVISDMELKEENDPAGVLANNDFVFIFKDTGHENTDESSGVQDSLNPEKYLVVPGIDRSLYGTVPGMSLLQALVTSASLLINRKVDEESGFQMDETILSCLDILKDSVLKRLEPDKEYRRLYSGDCTLIFAELGADRLLKSSGADPRFYGEYQAYLQSYAFAQDAHGISGKYTASDICDSLDRMFAAKDQAGWRRSLGQIRTKENYYSAAEKALPDFLLGLLKREISDIDFRNIFEKAAEIMFMKADILPILSAEGGTKKDPEASKLFSLDSMAWVPGRDLTGSLKSSVEYLLDVSDNWYQF